MVDKVEELRGVGVMKEEVEGLDDGERGEARGIEGGGVDGGGCLG